MLKHERETFRASIVEEVKQELNEQKVHCEDRLKALEERIAWESTKPAVQKKTAKPKLTIKE